VIRDVRPDDLDSVAQLLARRHARVQGAARELNPAFARPAEVRAALPADPVGWVQVRSGRVAASLLWEPHRDGALSGLLGAVGDPDDVAELYAVAGAAWVADGRTTHEVVVPSIDRALWDRLLDLSFGRQTAYAVRSLSDGGGAAARVADVEVERAGLERLGDVVALGDLVARHHEGSPVFDRHSNEFYSGLPESYRDAVETQDARVLLAIDSDAPVGLLLWRPWPPVPFYDERSAEMLLLAVHPQARGRGVGRLLVTSAMRDMASFGHTCVVADWRTTNLEASRFWPAMGLLTVAHRYARTVPDRPAHG
jgi:ribosomal protein S18 acetylase RimI-like enzyme